MEAEAVRRIIFLAEQAGAAIYFVHLSSREAIKSVAEAKAKNLPVYCETCPHYLAFNDEVYSQERAIQFIRFPPIRSAADQAALWKGVVNGTIDCIGTDHSAAYLSLKRELSEGKSFNEVPGGMGQIENRVPFMYSEGVASGRISVNRLVELVSTNPAKLFGLYPKKGIVGAGSDADIVMFIYREDYHRQQDEGGTGAPSDTSAPSELIIAKQRNGPVGNIEVMFHKAYTSFYPVDLG